MQYKSKCMKLTRTYMREARWEAEMAVLMDV